MKQIRYTKSISTILVLALSAIAISCTRKGNVDYDLNIDETLRWNIVSEPPTLDSTLSNDTTSGRVLDALMAGLTRYSFKDGEVSTEPSLASSWQVTPDQKTFTFTLRSDAKWTDGVPFTGQQVIDGWKRLLTKKTGSEYANFLFNVKNAQDFYEGKITDFAQVGIKLSDDKQKLIVQLEQSQSYFPSLLAHQATYPIRIDLIEKFGDKYTEAANYQSLGPYKLKIWDHDKAVVLERNDGYFGKKAKTKYILGRVVGEASTALNMFKKGELDALDTIPKVETESIRQMKEYRLQPSLAVYYYELHTNVKPFDDLRVRKAINMAIDREEINKVVGGTKIPAYNIVPPGLVGHDASIGLKFNAAAARKLLDEAGYKDRSTFPHIKLGLNTDENHQRIAENVQAQLKRNLGIEIEILNEEWKTYLKATGTNKYNFHRFAWVGDYPDADTFINLFVTNGGNNKTRWGSAKYDELVKKGLSEGDKEKRKQIYGQAMRLLNEEEVPVIPIYYYRDEYLISNRVKNYPLNMMFKFYPEDIELVK